MNWTPPPIPTISAEERQSMFEEIVDVSDGVVYDDERWHDPSFIERLMNKAKKSGDRLVAARLTFGKHKGKLWEDLPIEYLEWFVSAKFTGKFKKKFWKDQRSRAREELSRRKR